jgi:hypothetical protein
MSRHTRPTNMNATALSRLTNAPADGRTAVDASIPASLLRTAVLIYAGLVLDRREPRKDRPIE